MKNLTLVLALLINSMYSLSQCDTPVFIGEEMTSIVDSNYFCYKAITTDGTLLSFNPNFGYGYVKYNGYYVDGCFEVMESDLTYLRALDLTQDDYINCDDIDYITNNGLTGPEIEIPDIEGLTVLQIYSNAIEFNPTAMYYTSYIACLFCDEVSPIYPSQKRCLRTYRIDLVYYDSTIERYYFVKK